MCELPHTSAVVQKMQHGKAKTSWIRLMWSRDAMQRDDNRKQKYQLLSTSGDVAVK